MVKNKTLTKNMPNVKWHAIPPVRGPNPQGVNYGNNKKNNGKKFTSYIAKQTRVTNRIQGLTLLAILILLVLSLQA